MTVAVGLVPPAPEQVSENEELVDTGPVLRLPLIGSAPLQLPAAVQAVALVEVQVKVDVPPPATMAGTAANAAVGTAGGGGGGGGGGGAAVTVTVAVATGLLPPAPLQVIEYDVLAASAPVLWVPLGANAPDQPPVAVQAEALVELQVSVAAPPAVRLTGLAVRLAVGSGLTVIEAELAAAESVAAPVTPTPRPQADNKSPAAIVMATAKYLATALFGVGVLKHPIPVAFPACPIIHPAARRQRRCPRRVVNDFSARYPPGAHHRAPPHVRGAHFPYYPSIRMSPIGGAMHGGLARQIFIFESTG
jgi:hypothetical protein